MRVLSALVLFPVALGAIWFGGVIFGAFVAAICVAAAWELGRMLGAGPFEPLAVLLAAAAVVPLAVFFLDGPVWALTILAIAAALALPLAAQTGKTTGTWVLGVLYIGLPALALVGLRTTEPMGLSAVILVFIAVWATDIGAYFVGRRIGGPKLAPSISPGKTWSGAVGGVVASGFAGIVLALTIGGASIVALGLVAAVLSVAGQIGDLVESALKRRAGVKDSSRLIPGHGGVLDRVDGLFFAAVAAFVIGAARTGVWAPGSGVMVW
ncbi:Phosphatidate cytidylyltransferase [hydrothermal vent metagenome]|uniref:Phosphatidate cytidylyltransferase n=1 Tax=hydrothermal vent metagenome TaxID=652676 RepID=A0A3B0T6C9_9ZZZZ